MPKGVYKHSRVSAVDRFWSKVKVTSGCWIWQGKPRADGYGTIWTDDRRQVTAHHFSYELFYGATNLLACHTCDNRICVRPDHLFAGTSADNAFDRTSKLRSRGPSKLTEKQVRKIRRMYASGKWFLYEIAARFGMTKGAIYGIVRFKRYKYFQLTDDERGCLLARQKRKLSPQMFKEIQRRYRRGDRPVSLARDYGVSATRIVEIGKHGY